MLFSPLEQFSIISLLPLRIGNIYFSFTNSSLFLLLTTVLVFTLFQMVTQNGGFLIPAPLLVVLELVSYCFRAVSLGVRLFANMMAGHTLVKILSGFAWTMLSVGGILGVASVIPFAVVFALTGLEIGVACLQAYVF